MFTSIGQYITQLTCPKTGQILDISADIPQGNAGQISKSAFGLIIKVANDWIRNLKQDGQKVVQLVRWSDCQDGQIPRFHCSSIPCKI